MLPIGMALKGQCPRCARTNVPLFESGSPNLCRWCLYETMVAPAQYLASQGEGLFIHKSIANFVGDGARLYSSPGELEEVAVAIVKNWLLLYLMKNYPGQDAWMRVDDYLPQVLISEPADPREPKESREFRRDFVQFVKKQVTKE
jgi:hypothetical protein